MVSMMETQGRGRYRRNASHRDEELVKLQTRVPAHVWVELERVACARRESKSWLVERLIVEGLARLEGETA